MMDEKGRLFGKINIVDLLVILVVIVGAVFVGLKLTGHGGVLPGSSGGKTPVTYTVLVENVEPEVYENIKGYVERGDATLMASGELLDGQVVDVSAEPHVQSATLGTVSNTLVLPIGEGKLDLTFTIKCNVVNATTTEIGTQEVRIGKTHIVKTNRFELANGVVLNCTWGDDAA